MATAIGGLVSRWYGVLCKKCVIMRYWSAQVIVQVSVTLAVRERCNSCLFSARWSDTANFCYELVQSHNHRQPPEITPIAALGKPIRAENGRGQVRDGMPAWRIRRSGGLGGGETLGFGKKHGTLSGLRGSLQVQELPRKGSIRGAATAATGLPPAAGLGNCPTGK